MESYKINHEEAKNELKEVFDIFCHTYWLHLS